MAKLIENNKDCEITYKDDKITFHGSKSDILKAKIETTTLISELLRKNYTEMEEHLKISKDVQWQYEHSTDKWKNFPVYLNSLIESKYIKDESIVSLYFYMIYI